MIPLDYTTLNYTAFLMTFNNGSIGILNFDTKKLSYLSDSNHNETIFEVEFRPDDKNVFATASYDGTIRIWDANSLRVKQILEDKFKRRDYTKDFYAD